MQNEKEDDNPYLWMLKVLPVHSALSVAYLCAKYVPLAEEKLGKIDLFRVRINEPRFKPHNSDSSLKYFIEILFGKALLATNGFTWLSVTGPEVPGILIERGIRMVVAAYITATYPTLKYLQHKDGYPGDQYSDLTEEWDR